MKGPDKQIKEEKEKEFNAQDALQQIYQIKMFASDLLPDQLQKVKKAIGKSCYTISQKDRLSNRVQKEIDKIQFRKDMDEFKQGMKQIKTNLNTLTTILTNQVEDTKILKTNLNTLTTSLTQKAENTDSRLEKQEQRNNQVTGYLNRQSPRLLELIYLLESPIAAIAGTVGGVAIIHTTDPQFSYGATIAIIVLAVIVLSITAIKTYKKQKLQAFINQA